MDKSVICQCRQTHPKRWATIGKLQRVLRTFSPSSEVPSAIEYRHSSSQSWLALLECSGFQTFLRTVLPRVHRQLGVLRAGPAWAARTAFSQRPDSGSIFHVSKRITQLVFPGKS